MGNIRVMIVDDSTFSIAVLKRMLQKDGIEIVGTALNMSEAIQKAQEIKPDLITMDMTLPDGDGIECSKQILKHLQGTKIIAISAMMDEEIIQRARKVGIKGYLQKPVDQTDLDAAIERLFEGEELYGILKNNFEEAFKESIFSFLKREIGGEVIVEKLADHPMTTSSSGISVAIGIIGRHDGRLIMDMSENTALAMTRKILQDDGQQIDDAINFLSEFTNVIGGNACSLLNGLNRSFGLRVSPPTVFRGKDIIISIGDIMSESFVIKTDLGDVFMNVGFQKGDVEWM
ncbi:response regulator [Acetobacterium wieringae]|uniref:Stage 0 sporulation protein A homolog n=1 Tax=Acetobacterium wieringae TaxID=52694 RepID=A0ABY6H9Q1_9FIRM|nr:response regulator [Acetobacterium wieringae]URN82836.1 response regulator [Acetobacterium wieringae]UYO61210.1 response regulator [Acetobacterium wieringae]VUZ29125.1 Chemotaxis response regulator protein-glutamate methylesterase [Acetobacterium wieringae]